MVEFPQCTEVGCSARENIAMASCADRKEYPHRIRGTTDKGNAFEAHRCWACVSKRKRQRRLEARCIEAGCPVEGYFSIVCFTGCDHALHNTCGKAEYLAGVETPESILFFLCFTEQGETPDGYERMNISLGPSALDPVDKH